MSSECVKVMVRVRPLNGRERSQNCKECVDVDLKSNCITIKKPNDATCEKAYTYDAVFAQNIAQQSLYEASAFPLVENVFEGYNGTIFAYGQTGCGKTHTMMGDPKSAEEKGIIPRTFQHIINVIESEKSKQFLVRVSFLEIYNEEIHDLLSKDPKAKYELKQSPDKGVFVKDLNQVVVKSVKEMEALMHIGNENRSVGATLMNKDSSRSHSIFTIYIETSQTDSGGNQHFRAGKLNLVDLAGSERQSKTQATGDRLKEANKINLSLSALGNVISALVDGKTHHIPYRDSKLTRLLEDSLGGNTKTIMIAAISPADNSYDETSGTLRYASRAKNIKNAPKINEDPKDALLKEYADEISRLRMMLEGQQQYQGNHNGSSNAGAAAASASGGGKGFGSESQLKQLEIYKAEVAEEKQRMLSEMENKDKKLQAEREAIEEMKLKLEQLELNTMQGGGGAQEQREDEQKKYQELKKKLKKQQKLKEQLLEERRKNEENLLRQGEEHQSMQDEISDLRESNKLLRKRLKQALEEVNDMLNEAGDDKEELLDAVRTLEKDNALNKAILDILLTEDEYEQIRDASTYDEDAKVYRVPAFILKNKEIRFPKLPQNQAMEQVNREKESRKLEFQRTHGTSFDAGVDASPNFTINNKNTPVVQSDSTNRGNSRGRSKTRKASTNQKFGTTPIEKTDDYLYQSSDKQQRFNSNSHSNNTQNYSNNNNNNFNGFAEVSQRQNPRKMIQGVVLEPVADGKSNSTNLLNLIERSNPTNATYSFSAQPDIRRQSKNNQLKPLIAPLPISGKTTDHFLKPSATGGGTGGGIGAPRFETMNTQNYF